MPGASGVNGAWNAISTAQDIAIEQNGYLLVYLSTQVTTDVYFDNLNIKLKSGNLFEETHYYPFGLPIHNLGTAAAQQKENRLKYQSNEYIEDNDLRWMNFNARQYDPQIGRFLSIDPLAYVGGQQVHSPYAAMGNNPGMMVDPNGTRSKYTNDPTEDGNLALLEHYYRNMFGKSIDNVYNGGVSRYGMNNTMLEYAGGGGSTLSGKNTYSYEMFKQLLSGGHTKLVSNSYKFGYASFELSDSDTKELGWTYTGVIHDGTTIEWDTPDGAAASSGATPRIINEIIPFGNFQQQNGGFWDGVVEAHKALWNSPLARAIVPDKISIGMGGDLAAFVGVGAQPINISILTRGKEPGVYLTPTFNVNAGYGAFVSGGFEFTASYYIGNPQDITASMLQGHTFGGMATGGYLGSLSVGGSYSPTNRSGTEGFVNGSVGVGLGYGLFIGGQYQYTPGYGPLWQWKK